MELVFYIILRAMCALPIV